MFSNLTASFDPIFWPIHVNVDRLWWEWQQRNPQSLPNDLDAVLTPWSYTIADTLDMARFGYEYVKCAYLVPVGLATPVGRFVSRPISLPDTLRGCGRLCGGRLTVLFRPGNWYLSPTGSPTSPGSTGRPEFRKPMQAI